MLRNGTRREKRRKIPVKEKNCSNTLRKMLRKLFLIVTAVNIVRFSEGKAIQDWNFKLDATNGAPNELINENSSSKTNRIDENPLDDDHCVDCQKNSRTCPYESKELCLIFSLSKIAKIQIASLSEVAAGRGAETKTKDPSVEERKEVYLDYPKRTDNLQDTERTKSSSVQCRAIRDVYIPEVKQHLPAFACQFGNNRFILSSARFLQDRRSQLDINVNEDTFKNIKSTPKVSRSNEFNVVPALLVLNTDNNGYRIEMQGNVSNEQEGN